MKGRSFLHVYLVSLVVAIFCVFFLAAIRFSGAAFISWIGIISPIIMVNIIYCLFLVVLLFVFYFQDIIEKRKNKWITKDLKEYF